MSIQLKPLKQSNGVSCGQTSVAMLINYFTGKNVDDVWVDQKYGFSLMYALETETNKKFLDLNLTSSNLSSAVCPFILGAGYPLSSTGRGHIVAIESISGDSVTYCDPADGQRKTKSSSYFLNCEQYPQGSFIFSLPSLPNTQTPLKPVQILDLILNMHSGKIGLEVEEELTLRPGVVYLPNVQKTRISLTQKT